MCIPAGVVRWISNERAIISFDAHRTSFEGAPAAPSFHPIEKGLTTETLKLQEVPQEAFEAAETTTDWFSLFYRRANRYSLLNKEQEVELAQAIERGDLQRAEVSKPRPSTPGPDPGGDVRADPRV